MRRAVFHPFSSPHPDHPGFLSSSQHLISDRFANVCRGTCRTALDGAKTLAWIVVGANVGMIAELNIDMTLVELCISKISNRSLMV